MEWNYLAIMISGILGLFIVLIEARRKVRKNLALRVVASVFAVAALALIALPPSYQKDKQLENLRTVVLLTEGFEKDSLSAFSNPIVIASDEKLLDKSGIKSGVLVPSIDYFLSQNPDVRSLHIIGTGLPDEELALLRNTSVRFNRPGPAFGFHQVAWQASIRSSDELVVSGTFNNNSRKDVKIVLQGLSSDLDSAVISADSIGVFKLTSIPRQLGIAINYLIVTTANDTLSVEKVPFEVEPVKPVRIFILSSAPNFEANFLKRWLAENKFPVAVRNRISKGKFSTEFLEIDPIGLNFQSATLEKFDVVIADEGSINELSQQEISSLRDEIRGGLGLLVVDDNEVNLKRPLGSYFPVLPIAETKNISVNIPDINFHTTLPGIGANQLAPQPYDQPLAWDSKNHILVNSFGSGLGRIVFSTLNSTYSLNLSGNTSQYSSLWTYLIERAARQPMSKSTMMTTDPFPVVGRKTWVVLESNSAKIPELSGGEGQIGLKQNADLPQRWTGAYWPIKPGWNTLKAADGGHINQFVFEEEDWLSVRNARDAQATRKFAEQSTKSLAKEDMDAHDLKYKVPPVYFYLLLLACFSYLWIERKFYSE